MRLLQFLLLCIGLALGSQVAARADEAYFVVGSPPQEETFVIRLVDTEKIQQARDILAGGSDGPTHVMGTIVKAPAFYNDPWSFHLDTNSIQFFEVAIEVCDGAIAYVEENLDEVGGAFLPNNVWCPWGSRLEQEIPTPEGAEEAVTIVSAASFGERAVAPDSLATAFGLSIGVESEAASELPLPLELGGVSVRFQAGADPDPQDPTYEAPLIYVDPGQVNFLVPPDAPAGVATVTVTTSDGRTLTGYTRVEASAPALFAFGAAPDDSAAAFLVRVSEDGSVVREAVFEQDAETGAIRRLPIAFGPENEQLIVELYGTGIRGALADETSASIGGQPVEILFAGAQPDFPGLDQVNLSLPRTLADAGVAELMLTVAGEDSRFESNRTRLEFSAAGELP
ncbi:MAG: hypothetical protein KIT09_34585 [Bryobacteraceae bacterium]|nr:hypothetical protein [Bryobacteraceae bacterium]